MTVLPHIRNYLSAQIPAAPLAVFRIIFGAIMFGAIVRFFAKGWVFEQYIKPDFFFSYYGFEWIKPLGESGTYLLFGVVALSFLMITLGWFYRLFSALAFVSFTYTELMDLTNYLNHYYFISIVCFLLIFLPAHRHFSLDVFFGRIKEVSSIPRWTITVLCLQLGMVYFFAGVAKLNHDWLIEAMPLKYWLASRTNLPIIGSLFDQPWTAWFFSWSGAIYDLTIPFLLIFSRTRPLAYVAVIIFHVLTAALFQIGMFPYIMIGCTLIFFPPQLHQNALYRIRKHLPTTAHLKTRNWSLNGRKLQLVAALLIVHFVIQIALPFRHLLYPGNLYWTEQGYRFSWRVMLMEKAGNAFFYVTDPATGGTTEITNRDFLTPVQEKMMATQPDMLIQFANLIDNEYRQKGIGDPIVTADVFVTLNGSGTKPFIDNTVDLSAIEDGFGNKEWVLPFNVTKKERYASK